MAGARANIARGFLAAAVIAALAALAVAWWWFGPCVVIARLPSPLAVRLQLWFPCRHLLPFSRLWVFGDSTVDTGWFRIAPYSGEPAFDTYISNAALGAGRPTSSPGAMSVEVLAGALHLSAAPANQSGTDYATGGARDTRPNTEAGSGFPNAVPTATQIQNYLAANTPGARELFVVSSGGNDVAYALKTTGIDQSAYVQGEAQALADAIQSLAQHGAQSIIVMGLPESFGTDGQRALRALHDSALQAALTAASVPYLWADFDGLRKLVEQANGGTSPFGLSHYLNSNPVCIPQGATTGITSDWAYVCSNAAGAPFAPAGGADPGAYEFADDSHWATGGQKVLGGYFYCLAAASWRHLYWPATTPPYNCGNYAPLVHFTP